jgi:hypothetical protein
MKRLITILTILSTIDLVSQANIGQSFELPPDTIIRKCHIKTIKSYFSNDSKKNTLDMIWSFDKSGNLISRELIDKDDPSVSKDLYFYENNRKVEQWEIGTWIKYDTLKTKFYYDDKNRLIKTLTKGKYGMFNRKLLGLQNTASYKYINDNTAIVTYEGNNLVAMQSGPDSLVYNRNKLLLCQFNLTNDLKIVYSYNLQKQLVSKSEGSISDPTYIMRYSKFTYENGLLIREEYSYTDFEDKSKQSHSTTEYTNNSKGLLEKVARPLTWDNYKYEFYK